MFKKRMYRCGGCVSVCFAVAAMMLASNASQGQPKAATTQGAAAVAASVSSSNGASTGQATAPSAAATASLAALPAPLPPELLREINTDAQSKALLDHLNEVIRFYRLSVAPIQRIGELSDTLYAQQAESQATEVGQLAFQSARGQAGFLARVAASQGVSQESSEDGTKKIHRETQETAKRLAELQLQQSAMQSQEKSTSKDGREALLARRADIDGQIKVDKALFDALSKMTAGPTGAQTELQANIDRLQHSVPELIDGKLKPVTASIESVSATRDKGVTTQATILIQLLGTESAINDQITNVDLLTRQANDLRDPLVRILRATLEASVQLQRNTDTRPSAVADKQKKYDDLTETFVALSDVAVPMSQEVLVLEQTKANLVSWRSAVNAEHRSILHALLTRLLVIALALGVLFLASEIWRRYAIRYVTDIRRRRQILVVRRMVTGFLSIIVLTLGFVTQFNSLVTFAGFITAGIAVGLQTILLSVAAYFFIVGRLGIKVGDRITVAGVTGDVINVGLVRFYLVELSGTGTELHATGRIAVFANSVLFQTGTPIYKQIPGTEYVWRQITYKIKPGADYKPIAHALDEAVGTIYATYREKLEAQHSHIESWLDAPLEAPRMESRVEMNNGLEYTVLYPVEISNAASIDEQVVQSVTQMISQDPALAELIDGQPSIRAVIKS